MSDAHVIVSRRSPEDLKIRSIEVFLDGNFKGELAFGEELAFDVALGPHTLLVTNKLKSRSLDFEAAADEQIAFKTTGLVLGGLWMIMSMLGTVPYRVTLERTEVVSKSE